MLVFDCFQIFSLSGLFLKPDSFQVVTSSIVTGKESELQTTVKPVLSGHSKRRQKIVFQDRLSHNAGQKYCRMLQREHSAIHSTFVKLPIVIKIFVLSIFEWPLKTGFTVSVCHEPFSLYLHNIM